MNEEEFKKRKSRVYEYVKMILYYSGNPTGDCEILNKPENINKEIMLTYTLQLKGISKRFRKYIHI